MKKLGLTLALGAAVLAIGVGSVGAGNPPTGALRLESTTVDAGAVFFATFFGCAKDETVNFDFAGTTVSAPCNQLGCFTRCGPDDVQDDVAPVDLTAPAASGTYTLTAVGLTSGATASATITVVGGTPSAPSGGLPTTGSDSARMAQVAAGLAAVGAGLVVVAGVRRRKTAA